MGGISSFTNDLHLVEAGSVIDTSVGTETDEALSSELISDNQNVDTSKSATFSDFRAPTSSSRISGIKAINADTSTILASTSISQPSLMVGSPSDTQLSLELNHQASVPVVNSTAAMATSATTESLGCSLETKQLVFQDITRSYTIYTPSSYNPNTPTSVVLAFHGGMGNGQQFADTTGLADLAEQEGFILVAPEAVNGYWNDGRSSPSANIDDVGFIQSLIAELSSLRNINPQQIFATGHSNGGAFTQRLGLELSDQLAAIATVAGSLSTDLVASTSPKGPISVLMINGTADPILPWGGGDLSDFESDQRGVVFSVPDAINYWWQSNQCSPDAYVQSLPDADPTDGCQEQKMSYTNGLADSSVTLLSIIGGGHSWPGSTENSVDYGTVCNDFNASQTIWDYFQSHKLNLSINDMTIVEGSSNNLDAVFTVSLSAANSHTVTVNYATTDGIAIAGSDYTAVSGLLVFAPGETSKTIAVPILNDNIFEPDKTFALYLTNETGALIADGQGIGTITDTLTAAETTILPAGVENLTLTGTANVNGTGNSNNNIIAGNSGNNILGGGGGTDSLSGGAGNDILITDGSDFLDGGDGIDTITSSINFILTAAVNVENLTLTGGADLSGTGNSGNNVITGNSGANVLNGNGDNDTLIGGLGNDILLTDGGDSLDGGDGNDTVQSSISFDLVTDAINIENLILSSTATDINGTGNNGNNIITGNSGNNVLDGGSGIDTLSGGAGNDMLITDGGDYIDGGTGTDTIQSSISFNLTTDAINIENLILSGTANINGTGNILSNMILGNSGNNILDGGIGVDSLSGWAGDDILITDGNELIDGGDGIDTVQSSVTFDLANGSINVENLTLTGSLAIGGTGNSSNNLITGNSGANTLNGNGGFDTLIGSGGNDTIVTDGGDFIDGGDGYDVVSASVSFNLTNDAINIENLSLSGTANLNGTGNSGNNIITGNSGSNILDGGSGTDSLSGGAGDDILITDGNDLIDGGDGIDTAQASVSVMLTGTTNVENLTLVGSADLTGTGNSGNNVITGNSGNNTLNGNGGNDTLSGGSGNDTIVIDGGDWVDGGNGLDAVQASLDFNLAINATNVENLTLIGTANLNGTGNSGNNVITGNSGANILDGWGGNDILNGGAGNDILTIDGNDIIDGGSGSDTVQSWVSINLATDATNVESLTLMGTGHLNGTGNSGSNLITGNSGNNILTGGGGQDTLIGGGGTDTFVFNSKVGGMVTLQDFTSSSDVIRVSASGFGGGLTAGVLTNDKFVIGTVALDASDRFIYNKSSGALFFDPDGAGKIAAVQFAVLANSSNLDASNILVF